MTAQPWWNDAQADLRGLAVALLQRERPGHTLQPTSLLHEAYLRLAEHRNGWSDMSAFYAAASTTLRRVLVEYARSKKAAKRPPESRRVMMDTTALSLTSERIDLIDLDEALARLGNIKPQLAQLVEIRFFGGLTEAEAAEVLGISRRTVQLQWRAAKAWLRRALSDND